LTPAGDEPYTFAVGRLFHDDPAVIPLLIARQRFAARAPGPRRALVASNCGGAMNLLEAFSRSTVNELRNSGYETTAFYGKDVNRDDLRRLLPENDVFLWEGHHNALMCDYGFTTWDEPLPPSLVFLQSCKGLFESKALPLLSRGAIGVVGSSTRIYSASGGACSLAFFDALLYENRSVGAALRQAKNFLLAYSVLKEKRIGKDAHKIGANLRAAWAFTLWGDPTLELPRPVAPADARPVVRHQVDGDTIRLIPPAVPHERVASAKYRADLYPNARLAGLLHKDGADAVLAPFLFAEIPLPDAPSDAVPTLTSRLPASRFVFLWDARRRTGYLLAEPTPGLVGKELRFRVTWQTDKFDDLEAAVSGE
jgi:hypothetical protein